MIWHKMADQRCKLASARTRVRASYETTAVRSVRQDGRVMRVHLEEHVSVAARMMPILKGVAERDPVTRTSEHA